MQYRYGKVLWDLIHGKVSIKEFIEAMKFNSICAKITNKKRINFTDLKCFRAERIKETIDLHNDYTTGSKIHVEMVVDDLQSFLDSLNSKVDWNVLDIGKMITGISTKNPRPAIEGIGHFVDDIRRNRNE